MINIVSGTLKYDSIHNMQVHMQTRAITSVATGSCNRCIQAIHKFSLTNFTNRQATNLTYQSLSNSNITAKQE